MLIWKPEYATGVELVDGQHRVLFEKINHLEEIAAAPEIDRAELEKLVAFLGQYAANHFTYEEQCMHRLRCPAHEENKRAHAQFIEVLRRFNADYAAQGPTRDLVRRLQVTCRTWILQHILKIDVRMRPDPG